MPLIILLIVALMVLFTFSALWWRFALAIHAFFKYLSEPFAFLAEKCLQAREGCRRGIERLLMWPPVRQGQNTGREEYSAAMDVVARLVLLIMSIAVFGGDLPFAQQRNAFILGLTNLTHIPLPLDVLGGILWLAVPALFGILVLDLLELTPSGTRLFSHIESKLVRRCFVAIAFIFLALAIFETALFFYYGQLPISSNLLIQEWKELALPIVFAFGLLIAAVSVVALWAFIFGFTGLLSVLVCVFYCVFALFHLVSSLIHMAVFGLGKMLTYVQLRSTELEDHKPVKVISGDIVLLPQPHEQDEIAPEIQAQEEIIMKVHMRNIVAFSFGRRSLAALDRFLGRLNHISGAELLLGYGGIDPYHSVKPEELTKVPGAKNITPSSKTLTHVLMQHGGGDGLFHDLSRSIVSEMVQVYSGHASGLILLYVDAEVVPELVPTIEAIKGSLPMCKIVLNTSLPEPGQRDERLQLAYDAFIDLHRREKIEVTFLTDPRSPFVSKKKLEMQDDFVALSLASIAVGSHQYPQRNPPFPQLVEWLGQLSPVVGFSCATAHVAEGKASVWWRTLRLLNSKKIPRRGKGDPLSVVNEEKNMMDVVLQNYDALTTTVRVNTSGHFIMIFDIPVPLTDRRFYECAEHILGHLHKKFPNGGGIVVREQGIADYLLGEGYFCSCICLYPLTKEAFLIEENAPLQLPAGGA